VEESTLPLATSFDFCHQCNIRNIITWLSIFKVSKTRHLVWLKCISTRNEITRRQYIYIKIYLCTHNVLGMFYDAVADVRVFSAVPRAVSPPRELGMFFRPHVYLPTCYAIMLLSVSAFLTLQSCLPAVGT